MRKSYYYLFFLIFTFCSSGNRTFVNEKIVFKRTDIGVRKVYHISRPIKIGDAKKIQYFGGHGQGFEIIYSDSSKIYYSNDRAVATPNHLNYETIGWSELLLDKKDTIIAGIQKNGKYWKEIISGKDHIGYLNVIETEKKIFDQSIESFRK